MTEVQTERNVKRIERVLLANEVETRMELVARYDKGSGALSIKGLGPKLSDMLEKDIRRLGPEEWEARYQRIPWREYQPPALFEGRL